MMRRCCGLVLLVLLISSLLSPLAQAGQSDPSTPGPSTPGPSAPGPFGVVEAFFQLYPQIKYHGLPDQQDQELLKPLLTLNLLKMLIDAKRIEDKRLEENSIVSGDVWVSLYEGASSAIVKTCSITGSIAHCIVSLTYNDPTQPLVWNDIFVLSYEKGGWRINDVIWGGDWAFMHKGSLQKLLQIAAMGAFHQTK